MSRVILSLLFWVGFVASAWSADQEIVGTAYARDGDDLVIEGVRIRLHDIDAFELDQKCSKGVTQWACGAEAKRVLDALVADKQVRCVRAQARESHGRQVMRCYVGELEINAEMVRLGYALDCPQFSQGRYWAIEREAQVAERGARAGTFADFIRSASIAQSQ